MNKSLLIIISGHPASGKTTLGKKISEKFSIPFVSMDSIKETIWDRVGWDHNEEEWNSFGKASFDLMYYFVEAELSAEKSVIIDSNFKPEMSEDIINKFVDKFDCKLLQIHCYAEKEVLVERFEKRVRSDSYHPGQANGLRKKGMNKFLSKLGEDNLLLDVKGETLKVDTTKPENIDHKKIFDFIEKNSGNNK